MKERSCRISVITLLAVFVLSLVMTVSASAEAAKGLSAELKTDKDDYVSGEIANITLSITNEGSETLENVSGEVTLPEDMKLVSGYLATDSYVLAAGDSREHKLSAAIEGGSQAGEESRPDDTSSQTDESEPDSSAAEQDSSDVSSQAADNAGGINPPTGSGNAAFWAGVMIVSAAALVVIGAKKKQGRRMFSMFLCAAMCLSVFAAEFPHTASAESAEASDCLTVSKDITVNGNKATITAKINGSPLQADEDTVRITFDSGDGAQVDPVTIVKGEAAGKLPQSYLAGKSFAGWYTDPEHTQEFFENTILDSDITLYAAFNDVIGEFEASERTSYYAEDLPEDMTFTLISDTPVTADNLFDKIMIEAMTGIVPESYTVTASDNEYTIVPEQNYTAGALYRVTLISDGVKFKDLEETVIEYSFRIFKPESEIIEMSTGLKYVDASHFQQCENESELMVDAAYYEEKDLKTGDVICLGDGTEKVDSNSRFVNIADSKQLGEFYIIAIDDSEPEDVFDNVDISFKKDLTNEILSDDFDPDALAQELYNSRGADQLNMMMAALLADSESVQEELGGVSLLANYSDPALTDFSTSARLKDDSLFDLSQKLKENLKVEVSIAEAENDNFRTPDPRYWCGIRFTFSYSDTIKNRLKIDASISITEYLNISLQGYKSFKFRLFKKSQLEFDYAINAYSQTDIEFKVLICSTNKKNEKWRDISKEISDMLQSDDDNDQDSLVAQMKDMLANQGGYITLCEIPLFKSVIPLISPITVFDINIDLDYVFKVNFAAGLSTKFSVLDATQVGIAGNSATGDFDGYRHDLDGGSRYNFDLSVCGYIGAKTGLKGSMTISFSGLKRLGEVGMEMEIGAYADIYGYAQYHLAKPYQYYDDVYQTFVGGYYLEIGVYIEIKVIAESSAFKAKAEAILLDAKIPLFYLGNKEVLLSMDEQDTTVVLLSADPKARYTNLPLSSLPVMTGTVLDITTGKVKYHQPISWGNISLRFSDRAFDIKWDPSKGRYTSLTFDKAWHNTNETAYIECSANAYYIGPYLQFTKNAKEGRNTVATLKVVWVDSTRVASDRIGKMCKVNFYSEFDGKRTLLESREVMAGQTAGAFDIDEYVPRYKYLNASWDNDPSSTLITNDTDFVFSGDTAQVAVAFIYYDVGEHKWTAEIRAVNMGETPKSPEHYENEHAHFKYWRVERGANNFRGMIPAGDGIRQMTERSVGTDSIKFTGRTVNMPYNKVYAESRYEALCALQNAGINTYRDLAYIYSAYYDFDIMDVDVTFRNYSGRELTFRYNVPYGGHVNDYFTIAPAAKRFVGFADEKDGEAKYENFSKLPKILADMNFYAVYTADKFTVDIQYFDEDTLTYKTYKKLTIEGGDKVPEEELAAVKEMTVAPEGVEYDIYRWFDALHKVEFEPWLEIVQSDLTLRLDLARTVDVTLDGGDGGRITSFGTWKTKSSSGYKLTLGSWAAKDPDDRCSYTLAGWKDSRTGEIYAVGQECTFDKPVTLTAVYKANARTYNVTVNTQYGVLKNGKQTDSFTGGYDDYLEFMAVYEGWLPDEVRDVDYTHTCTTARYQYSIDNLTVEIDYIWKDTINKYKVSLDPNGGTVSGATEFECDYGKVLDLSDLFYLTKSDKRCDYEIAGWKDQDGSEYAADGKLTVKGDTTISPIWKDGVYKEYYLIHEVDNKIVKSEKKRYGEPLTDPDFPEQAAGLAFSGWKWKNSADIDIERPETMPAETLTVYGTTTKCYVTYKLNGDIISGPTFTNVGSVVVVDGKYELEGNDVTEWTTEDVQVTDGSFIMPDHDVTFTATSTPKEYTVTINVEGEITTHKATFGTQFTLPEQPSREGYTFFWTSDGSDAAITTENGVSSVYIPARDITVTGKYERKTHNIYFVLDGKILEELTMKDVPVGQTGLNADYWPDDIPDGKRFTGWITGAVDSDEENGFIMPDCDVYFYGKLVDDGPVEVVVRTKSIPSEYDPDIPELDYYVASWILYCDKGGELELPQLEREGYELTWTIREDWEEYMTITDGKLKLSPDTEMTSFEVFAVFTKKTTD